MDHLTDSERDILFNGATEPPFTGALLYEKRSGEYVCKNCGTSLFDSTTKFDSGSGWPSFAEPVNREHVVLHEDVSHGMRRVEVRCAHCDAHLGHVFDDGPQEMGGLRYCVNSASLAFTPKSDDSDEEADGS